MVVPTSALAELAGRVTLVSGTFDPIHHGHVEYFRQAAQYGLPVLCNVSTDADVLQKHAPLLLQHERATVLGAIRYIDHIHVAETTTENVLRNLRPRYFAKGSDWMNSLPEEEVAVCAALGIEIVFLDAKLESSTRILERFVEASARFLEHSGRAAVAGDS